MKQKVQRHISITMTGAGLIVGFYWRDVEGDQVSDIQSTVFMYPIGQVLESAQLALNTFYKRGAILLIEFPRLFVVSEFLDDDATIFDMIADSEEPAQTLISRYVIERQG